MTKRRLAVILAVPDPWSSEIDGLRRALGDVQLGRITPHITIIPPINVRDEDLGDVVSIVETAAGTRTGPLVATVGPLASFAPVNPVLYLAVDREAAARSIFNACLVGKLERPQTRGFVPHVTVDINRPDDQHPAALALLSHYRVEDVPFDRLALMEMAMVDGRELWSPIADAVFGSATSVDAGSLRLILSTSSMVDPVTAASLGVDASGLLGLGAGDGLVITARDPQRRVLGVAAGRRRGRRATVFRTVFVVEDARGQGVGRRLMEAWERAAVAGGAVRAVAPGISNEETALLAHLGWNTSEPLLDRRFAS